MYPHLIDFFLYVTGFYYPSMEGSSFFYKFISSRYLILIMIIVIILILITRLVIITRILASVPDISVNVKVVVVATA